MTDPFRLPDGPVQIGLSGGRTSAYMLWRLMQANPDWSNERVKVIFTNTGREMPETLDFLAEIERRWSVPIIWLEYAPDEPKLFRVVSHSTASRDGEPFEALIRKRKYLPNHVMRFCTGQLKITTAKRYLRALGWDRWTIAVGIRADEPRRLLKKQPKERWTVWHPLAQAGVTKHIVGDFWRLQPFDLQLENINGTTPFGNCDGCFLKGEAKIAELIRRYPERAAWWERMEALASRLSGSDATFRKDRGRREMREYLDSQGDWIFDSDLLCQIDEGECTTCS